MKSIVYIFTTEPFPVGVAATKRIQSYCYGLTKNGIETKVLCVKPSIYGQPDIDTNQGTGSFENASITYTSTTVNSPQSIILRKIYTFVGVLNALLVIRRDSKSLKICVISYCHGLSYELPLLLLCKVLSIQILKEESEYPVSRVRKHNRIYKYLYLHHLYSHYNAIICMTSKLKSYFESLGIPTRRLLVVPQTIIHNPANSVDTPFNGLPKKYIAYSGTYNQEKDGVITLLRVFHRLSHDYPDLYLVMTGSPKGSDGLIFNDEVLELGLEQRVITLGWLSDSQMKSFFCNALILISLRPDNDRTTFSFPMKIAEYLQYRIPVITTDVGDLEMYLSNAVNAIIVNSDHVELVVGRIKWVLENYKQALKIAEEGFFMAQRAFDPVINVQTIINWCNFYEK